MSFNSYIFNPRESNCTGCGACVLACVHKALSMERNSEGFLYPTLDTNKCIRCGICEKVCPMTSERHQANALLKNDAYLVTGKDQELGLNCATIGLCTWISLEFVKNQNHVFGVILDETNWTVKHIHTQDIITVKRMCNSKYMQSDTGNTFLKVKELLKASKEVLYIGTPCQIAGLKGFLRKDYENLFTIDLICHGVFSPKLIPLEVNYWESLFQGKLSNLRFRSKKIYPWDIGGIVNFDIKNSNGVKHIERHASSSPTYYSFAYSGDNCNYNLRPSCYTCPFRSKGRYGDLTIGDAWGLSKKYKNIFSEKNKRNGISILLCNTIKGEKILEMLPSKFELYPITKECAFSQPAFLPTNRNIPEKRSEIYNNLNQPYGPLIERIFSINLEKKHKAFIRNYRKRQIKQIIKNLLFLNKIK